MVSMGTVSHDWLYVETIQLLQCCQLTALKWFTMGTVSYDWLCVETIQLLHCCQLTALKWFTMGTVSHDWLLGCCKVTSLPF